MYCTCVYIHDCVCLCTHTQLHVTMCACTQSVHAYTCLQHVNSCVRHALEKITFYGYKPYQVHLATGHSICSAHKACLH